MVTATTVLFLIRLVLCIVPTETLVTLVPAVVAVVVLQMLVGFSAVAKWGRPRVRRGPALRRREGTCWMRT